MKARVIVKFIKEISDTNGVSKAGKEWRKKEILVKCLDDSYRPELAVTVFNDAKISALGVCNEGDELELDLEISSNESKTGDRYFTNVNLNEIVSIEPIANSNDYSNQSADDLPPLTDDSTPDLSTDDASDDDLPF